MGDFQLPATNEQDPSQGFGIFSGGSNTFLFSSIGMVIPDN